MDVSLSAQTGPKSLLCSSKAADDRARCGAEGGTRTRFVRAQQGESTSLCSHQLVRVESGWSFWWPAGHTPGRAPGLARHEDILPAGS
jgi:hypothetical protein